MYLDVSGDISKNIEKIFVSEEAKLFIQIINSACSFIILNLSHFLLAILRSDCSKKKYTHF